MGRHDTGTGPLTADAAADRLARGSLRATAQRTPRSPVLVFGSVPDRADAAGVTQVAPAQAPRVQLKGPFGLGLITAGTWEQIPAGDRRLLVHNLVTHLRPGAHVRIDVGDAPCTEAVGHAIACGLEPVDAAEPLMFRRTTRTTVHDLVAEARARLVRTTAEELAARLATDPGCVVLDTRTTTDRAELGTVPGSIHTPRTTLEWRVDPSSGYAHQAIRCFDQCLVVMCSEGYSSSLGAASLQRLGFVNATDLVGGFMAWRAAGLPIERPDDRPLAAAGPCTR
jgi:rhodanese-related sulfurtransferase